MRPSSEADHDLARHGASVWSGIGFTIASCSAYRTMKGVMMPGVSAGSNQVGRQRDVHAPGQRPCGAAAPASRGRLAQ